MRSGIPDMVLSERERECVSKGACDQSLSRGARRRQGCTLLSVVAMAEEARSRVPTDQMRGVFIRRDGPRPDSRLSSGVQRSDA